MMLKLRMETMSCLTAVPNARRAKLLQTAGIVGVTGLLVNALIDVGQVHLKRGGNFRPITNEIQLCVLISIWRPVRDNFYLDVIST